ncbi:double-stranded RNA-binding protein 1-like [Hibiscus syriacus]|uniref:double-stranded RNA-binding protein 1-like n=1 Tax=Hibiscus syriacus TaxID=106335 RepID=UPI001921E43C|nr:double-stranded RNA-binding protein 1-like [Hibiscus syriacus]
MYKSRLQELCQKKAWRLPEYNTTKQGQDHNPLFEATVTVNGTSFQSRNPARSSKEAQNDAAHLAFLHFTSPPPLPDSGTSNAIANFDTKIADGTILSPGTQENRHSQVDESDSICKHNENVKDIQHMYKSLLQTFAQKRNLGRPVYSCEFEGPPHASRFRCKVTVNDKTFESLEFFPTIKEAEHAAAKITLSSLSPDAIEKEDCNLYKNLLQELTQKEGCPLPVYNTTRSGEAHSSTFVSIVKVKGEVFTGQEAKTKKLAEALAAKVACKNLKERKSNRGSMAITPAYKERRILSSSNVPSNVNADTQQDLGCIASSLLNAVPISGKNPQQDRINETFCIHDLSVFPQPKITTDWQSSSSLSDRSDQSVSVDDLSASNLPQKNSAITKSVEGSTNQSVEIGNISCNRTVVQPFVPNMKIPAGSTVLLMSDGHWVTLKLGSQANQDSCEV